MKDSKDHGQLGLLSAGTPVNVQPSQTPQGGLEERLQSTTTTSPPIVNNMEGYGFIEGSLTSFLGMQSGNYHAARDLFYGLIDLSRMDRAAAHEIYQLMNTADIAAMFIGIARLKELGTVTIRRTGRIINYEELQREAAVENIISKLVQIGYSFNAVDMMKNKGFNEHPTFYNSLKKRIARLSPEAKQKFTNAFLRSRPISHRERPERFDFYDVGEGRTDYTAADIYTKAAIEHMKTLYARNTAQQTQS